MATLQTYKDKLRSTAGFTLAEQLISMIFIGLLCIAVGTGISVAMNTFGKVNDQTNADQLLMRTIQEVNSELAYSESVEAASGTYSYISPSSGTRVTLASDSRGIVIKGTDIGGTGVNEVVLVPTANDMVPSFKSLSYQNTNNTWQYTVSIARTGSPTSTLAEQSMTVARGTA